MTENNEYYNSFSVQYIETIVRTLELSTDSDGKTSVQLDLINDDLILKLKAEMEKIWQFRSSAVEVIKSKVEASSQACLFGLVNDLEEALRVGFLLADRVVLIDYLFGRILRNHTPSRIDRVHLASVCSFLASCLSLAKSGRIVIIENPISWSPVCQQSISEISERRNLSVEEVGFVSITSVAVECNLFPYTLAESVENYKALLKMAPNSGTEAHSISSLDFLRQLFAGLQAERLLSDQCFLSLAKVPLARFQEVISKSGDFYHEFSQAVGGAGHIHASSSISAVVDKVMAALKARNQYYSADTIRRTSSLATVAGSSGAIMATVFSLGNPATLAASVLGLTGGLLKALKPRPGENVPMVAVFVELLNET